ncbi:unnamed protein product [Rotaria sp. Silwood1]|nr:unnamed protein product [Rotaria sp. Silwood1]CAF3688540.1 unnamed protein product [Rotaria sp. Silwood1]CAF4869747.1 unnamed protein product [Rotaria sp. Silwood1]
MIKRCLLTTIVLMVLYIIMTNSINDESFIPRDNININVGKKVRMECELNNLTINENRKILWLRIEDAEIVYYSNNRIISDERFYIEKRIIFNMINNTSSYNIIIYSLIIEDLRLSDSGTYSCQIDNNIIKLFSLNIVERPYFIIHEYSTIIRTYIGENISIICQAKGKPKPFIYWIKRIDENNQIILKNCSITSNICQLNFFNINYYYNGIYECLAKNFLGTIGRFYQIDVQFPPNVSILTNKTSYFIGDKLILECLIDANPKADIRWLYKSSYDIDHDKDLSQLFYREYFDHNHFTIDNDIWYIKQEQLNATRWKTTLFIKHIPRRLFNSKIICRAINHHGENEQIIKIIEKYHSSNIDRHQILTTPIISTSTLIFNTNQISLSNRTRIILFKLFFQ